MANATRITDINTLIARHKSAAKFCGDNATTSMLTDRIAELVIERQTLLSGKVNAASIAPVTPIQTTPKAKRERKPSKPAVKPEPIAPEGGVNAEPSKLAGTPKATTPKAGAKAGKPKTWQMTKAQRMERYAAQREFFAGPATKAQIARCNKAGVNLPADAYAFEAAEFYAAHEAKANGKRFHMIRRNG